LGLVDDAFPDTLMLFCTTFRLQSLYNLWYYNFVFFELSYCCAHDN